VPKNFEAPVVAITGASGYIGSLLLDELQQVNPLGGIIGLDINPLRKPIHNIVSYRMDLSQVIKNISHPGNITSLVHLAFNMQEGRTSEESRIIHDNNIRSLQNILRFCSEHSIKNFIYLSSHTVYGALANNPVPIGEDAERRANPNFQYAQSKILAEKLLEQFAKQNEDTNVTILRCSMVIGPSGDSFTTESFDKTILFRLLEYDPPLQFIHETDLAKVLGAVALNPKPGIYNVAGNHTINYKLFLRLMEKRALLIPTRIAYPLIQLMWKLGIQKGSSKSGLDLIRYPIILDTSKLRASFDIKMKYSSMDAVTAYVRSNLP